MSNTAKNRRKSTWTPLTNKDANIKIYNERRELVNKWFEKWTSAQRNLVVADLVGQCTPTQVDRAAEELDRRRPVKRADFVQNLPRVLSLYVFSFLDPRSLSRAAQVSWNWKQITELDQLWMAKSMRLGWTLTFAPSPYERGVWKRLYLQNIGELQCILPKNNAKNSQMNKNDAEVNKGEKFKKNNVNSMENNGRVPWRSSDRKPTDIRRNNYLENDDAVEKINKIRKKPQYGVEAYAMIAKTKGKVDTRLNCADKPSLIQKFPDSKPTFIDNRPKWAKHSPGSPFMAVSQIGDNNIDAGVRPRSQHSHLSPTAPNANTTTTPNSTAQDLTSKLMRSSLTRTPRDPPTSKLFPDKPWQLPTYDSDNE